ncbi:hypothetical protein GUJ93_ZPchr0006g42541 [Zizania palustris]|uniref:PGG domain-containing protein n=1 Tax=Zizania palustris TaxID=103762 RepID=A0A8J5T9C8_ZIZPA|nr:hypothetical protein GUJ93_ZPchr0006g42541 [Zizania palustris]KAG8076058.1 hypothetical protein GUJ93_ZPchr0006g42541 [Zizania palustris]
MVLDLFSLMGAYAAGSCRALKSSIYVWILVFAVFVYVGIHILVSIRVIPGTLKQKVRTTIIKILSKCGIHDEPRSSHQEKEVEDARKFILLFVTFAATVTYQAGLNPPGGFWAENGPPPYKHRPATSVLRSNYFHRYNTFVSFNSTSFVASLVTVILLLSPELSKHGIRSKALAICVVADLLGLVGAYAAGCCRDVATSFYVMFIIIVVLICFAMLAGIFIYKPVAEWLENIKSTCVKCMGVMGRALSLSSKHGSNRLSNAEQENSASHQQASVHANGSSAEHSASEPGQHSTVYQRISDTKKGESPEEHPNANKHQTVDNNSVFSQCISNTKERFPEEQLPVDKQHTIDTKEPISNSQHPPGTNQQSANMENQSTISLGTNMDEAMSSTEHPSAANCKQTTNTNDCMSVEDQQDAGKKEQSSTDNLKIPMEVFSEQNMPASHVNGTTVGITESVMISVPAEACDHVDSSEQHKPVGGDNHNNEISENNSGPERAENDPTVNTIEKHLNKTRTYLLLLSILAVSVTYQSGLNPPGGFWSESGSQHSAGDFPQKKHSAGDRILEDTNHPRFIAFFYLNAVAFVASIVTILLLLNKLSSAAVTKRRALQTVMIVNLLSLTEAFVTGSCREAKKTIYSSVSVCLILAYVAVHIMIAIWFQGESGRHAGPASPQSGQDRTEDIKELGRRRNLLLILSILAATVTYQAGMNPPGGFWSDNKDVSGKPGNPILQDAHSKRYDVFYYSNSISFVSSVVITILLVNKESCEHGIKSYALRVCLVAGLLGLLIAYVAGCCRNRKQSIYLIIIAVAVLISLVIQVLLFSSSMHNTLARLLSRFMEYLESCLFSAKKDTQGNTPKSPETSDPDEKEPKKRHKYLMLLAILAASITYQAGLNPPGGSWSETESLDHHLAGNPILHDINARRYKTFFCFNSFSFMASIVVIMLLLIKSVRKKDVPLEVLNLIMTLDLMSLMTAFAAGVVPREPDEHAGARRMRELHLAASPAGSHAHVPSSREGRWVWWWWRPWQTAGRMGSGKGMPGAEASVAVEEEEEKGRTQWRTMRSVTRRQEVGGGGRGRRRF